MDIADSATDAFDHDLALAFLSNDEHAIREIDAALQRINEGTYGICEETGDAIPAGRLRAIPWTRWTKEAAEKLERKGLIRGLKLGLLRSVKKRAGLSPSGFLPEEPTRPDAHF
jgi:RNA polymerase-binding transcription factor DksA